MKKTLLALFLVLFVFGGSALATPGPPMLSQTFTGTLTAPHPQGMNYTNAFQIQGFNTALGYLWSVELQMGTTASGSVLFQNFGENQATVYEGSHEDARITLKSPASGNPTLFNVTTPVVVIPSDLIIPGLTSVSVPASGVETVYGSGGQTYTSGLGIWQSPGLLTLPVVGQSLWSGSWSGNVQVTPSMLGDEGLSITYRYTTENPIPEPGSLLLLGSGLIGAASYLRRKRA